MRIRCNLRALLYGAVYMYCTQTTRGVYTRGAAAVRITELCERFVCEPTVAPPHAAYSDTLQAVE